MDKHGFYTGTIFDAYKYLGAHTNWDCKGTTFRTYAPAAAGVAVIGEFNGWQGTPMNRIDHSFFEVYVENANEGQMYKYRIFHRDGSYTDHCDPYGFGMELRPASASIIRHYEKYQFTDEAWMEKRTDCKDKPLNIYEIHLGSWKRKHSADRLAEPEKNEEITGIQQEEKENFGSFYSYTELADLLIPYLKENGYNYVEFMPLSEHPCDESWGYQCTGFFSPTSRYGTIYELMELVDQCHQNDIGILLDFVPVHFAVDSYGLARYDGTELYEYPGSDVTRSEWGSCNFIHSRGEVRSFLQSAAEFWLNEMHFDGLRMDAISNMIYWQGDERRGVNGNSVAFIRYMNGKLKEMHPGIILAAEDSTSFPQVTVPACYGGLGFDYKWDMGWMHDTLEMFQTGPEYRNRDYHKLTFSMMYFYDESYLLPLSHDEVVHGKATVLQKMNGDYEKKFPQAKTLYMYMYTHPGKKLNFMGSEIGQLREWDEKREQDWDILKYPVHDAFHTFMRELNKIYLGYPALSSRDYDRDGFRWADCNLESQCVYAFIRTDGEQEILTILNLSDRKQDYTYNLFNEEKASLLLSTDDERFGGSKKIPKRKRAVTGSLNLELSPFSGEMYLIMK